MTTEVNVRKQSLDSYFSNNLIIEIIIVGEKCVGKTEIIKNIKHNYISSIINNNIELYTLHNVKNNRLEKYHIFEIKNQIKTFYCAPITLLVYDINTYSTFLELKNKWNNYILKSNPNSLVIVIGNKYDIKPDSNIECETKYETETVKNWCDSNNYIFLEVSALFGYNLDNLINIIRNYSIQGNNNLEIQNKNSKSNTKNNKARYWCC